MKNHEKDDQKMIEKLNKLPEIEDQQTKASLFAKVNQSMEGRKMARKRKRKRNKWIVPSLATLLTAVLIMIVIQTGVFNQDQSTDQFTDSQSNMREIEQEELGTMSALDDEPTEEHEDNDQEQAEDEAVDETTDRDEDAVVDSGEEEMNDRGNQLVYYNDEYDLPIYNIAVADEQNMYAIPISLVDTAATGDGYPDDVYNRIETFIVEDDLGVYNFPFEEIEFTFSNDYHNITMTVADDYQFPSGSSQAAMFQKMINIMFADYPATEVNLQTESTDSIDLGPYGPQSTAELAPIENFAYKIYQLDDKERLLVPLEQTISGEQFYTIDEALLEMQYDQPDQSITGTIPSDAEFIIDPSDAELLRIDFEAHSSFGDNRATKEMIESILLTAKSFDFSQVAITFEDDLTSVDQFDLTEPISVPDGVNPILLH